MFLGFGRLLLLLLYIYIIVPCFCIFGAKRAISGEADGKLCIAECGIYTYIYVYICVCCTFITRRLHGRFYGLDLKKGNTCLGKPDIDTLDSSRVKKTAADSKAKGKKPDLHAACLVNSCQGKDAGVTTQFINTLALDVIQVLDSRNYFQSY